MASFFTRALDKLTPWRRGGELIRDQQAYQAKKKKREDQYNPNARLPNGIVQPNQDILGEDRPDQPKPQRPENIFTGLQNNLKIGQPQTPVVVQPTQDSVPPAPLVPGTVVRPHQSFLDKLRDQVDANTEADKYRRQSTVPTQNTIQSNAAVTARSAGAVASNFAGGLVGVGKGIVQLPSAIMSTPKLVRLGAAKLTGNKKAEENIGNDKGLLTSLTEKYDRLVHPVTQKLTTAELATDEAARNLAPWAPNYIKPTVKTLSNLLPIDALVAGLSKAKNGRSLLKEGEATAGEAGTAGTVGRGARTVSIPVRQDIPIEDVVSEAANIPVRTPTRPPEQTGPIIRELGGDAPNVTRIPTAQETLEQRVANNFNNQAPGRPDQNLDGVIRDPAKIITTKDVEDGRAVIDDYLKVGKISEQDHKDLVAELDKIIPADAPVPEGRPISVKQVNGIDVMDKTVVPTGLPETPGTVRVTTQTSPMEAKSEAVANAPITTSPAQLPAETQAILENPKQYSKRQVAAARNQRKLARQMAKTTEQTAEATKRIETASPAPTSGEGFTPTGEFGKSVNGGAYQKVSRQAEMQQAVQETSQMSPGDVIKTARTNQLETGGFNRRDIRNVAALFETKRLPRGSAEWNEARQILKEDGTVWGQTGALRNYTMRRTATADQLVSRYESKLYRLADDPSKIDSKWLDEVEAVETAYADARDNALAAYNRFTESPTTANAKAYHAAQDAAEKADKTARMTEYTVADKALKGNKDAKQVRELQKMAQDSDLYQMDAVDSSMLSGTGTFARNFVNSAIGGSEEGLFGGIASRIAKAITGENVGGGMGRGTLAGFGKGARNIVDASKTRASNAGKNPLEHVKNWATTGNQLGDTVIDSQVTHNVLDHYTQLLKGQGYKGEELTNRAGVMARQDPDNLGKMYAGYARAAAGLGSGIAKSGKIETIVKNAISDSLSFGHPNQVSELTAKLITRMTVGFPSAVGRTIVEGGKRATFGVPNMLKLFGKDARNNPAIRAQIIKDSIKQAGTGATAGAIFYSLGQNGLVTGAYPKDDPEERARWEREGISENSIKIGGNYYQLPSYLGSAAIPAIFAATLGRNDGDIAKSVGEVAKSLPAILPTDQASNWLDALNGRTDPAKFATQTAASVTRALTPAGALLGQIAKSFDPTKNDTTTGTALENFVDKVMSGIPGLSNNVPNKVDDAGNEIKNPNPLALVFGAASAVQGAGEKASAQMQAGVNSELDKMNELGVLSDSNLEGILDSKEKAILQKFKSGEDLGEGDLKKLQEAYVKGVSKTGDDTAYLEREQYDTNLSVLRLKKKLMEDDKTVKPSDLKKIDTAITRGEVYKEAKIPYEMIDAYQTTGIDEWRNMGDPEDDAYDPEMYQQLWAIDQMMTKKGVSYKKGALDKNKYYAKTKKGRGGSGGRSRASELSSDFGTLKAGDFAPSVRAYDTIDQQTGSVPIIRTVRPNIVHKIGSSG